MMGTDTKNNGGERSNVEYLAQLLKDKKQIQSLPGVFSHLERLLDDEISKVRISLFTVPQEPVTLPEPIGPVVSLSEKVKVPAEKFPDYNFVGRILGPQGHTIKELEKSTGCRIMVRGRGSMRDKKKEDMYRGKPNWEHLNEDLHVLIVVEDTQNRAETKLKRAVDDVTKLLVPANEGEDPLKRAQLTELAIMSNTYREPKNIFHQHRFMDPAALLFNSSMGLRSPTPAGAPLFLAPRIPGLHAGSFLAAGGPPPLISPTDAHVGQLLFPNPYEAYQYTTALNAAPTALLEYPGLHQSVAGAVPKVRGQLRSMREHPYTRATLS